MVPRNDQIWKSFENGQSLTRLDLTDKRLKIVFMALYIQKRKMHRR